MNQSVSEMKIYTMEPNGTFTCVYIKHAQVFACQNISHNLSFFFQAEDGIRDRNVTGVQTCALPISLPPPGLPFSLVFRAEPGTEDTLLRIASAYEAASKRRVPPRAFGPLPAKNSATRFPIGEG